MVVSILRQAQHKYNFAEENHSVAGDLASSVFRVISNFYTPFAK